jgi:hypothetical protein
MNDATIRAHFHSTFLRRYHASKHTRVLDEMGLLHGSCRADIAVINGQLIGFEIKSNHDSLRRLQLQIIAYNAVFDQVTIVVGTRHLRAVSCRVPKWWGIIVGDEAKLDHVTFDVQRKPRANPSMDPVSVAQLLWKNEVVELLRNFGAPPSLLKSPRRLLYQVLAWHLSFDDLKRIVCNQLKSRKRWRDQQRPFQDDDLYRPIATSLDFQSRQPLVRTSQRSRLQQRTSCQGTGLILPV